MQDTQDTLSKLEEKYPERKWKFFPGSVKYVVSDTGDVYSVRSDRLLKPYPISPKYLGVTVEGISRPVHRVVALTYLDNPEELEDVHHIDHNTFNNNIDNLMWVSRGDNIRESVEYYGNGITGPAREALKKVVNKRVTKVDLKTGAEIATYGSVQDAQESMGKPRTGASISRVANGIRKSAYGYSWKWADVSQAQRASQAGSARLNSDKIPHLYQYTNEGEIVKEWKNFYWPETEFPELRADGIEASFSRKSTDRSGFPKHSGRSGAYKGFIWVEY